MCGSTAQTTTRVAPLALRLDHRSAVVALRDPIYAHLAPARDLEDFIGLRRLIEFDIRDSEGHRDGRCMACTGAYASTGSILNSATYGDPSTSTGAQRAPVRICPGRGSARRRG